jgi:hypothetical protein
VQSNFRKSDLVRIKAVILSGEAGAVGIVTDVYVQPQINKTYVQVLIGETINWFPAGSCELVQRGSYVVE